MEEKLGPWGSWDGCKGLGEDDGQPSPSHGDPSPPCFKLYPHSTCFLNPFLAYIFHFGIFHHLTYYVFALFI